MFAVNETGLITDAPLVSVPVCLPAPAGSLECPASVASDETMTAILATAEQPGSPPRQSLATSASLSPLTSSNDVQVIGSVSPPLESLPINLDSFSKDCSLQPSGRPESGATGAITNPLSRASGTPTEVFCCRGKTPYKPRRTDHEDLFSAFQEISSDNCSTPVGLGEDRAVQVVKQQNFGPVLSSRYFKLPNFEEISQSEFISSNYKRLNSFKNYKCGTHNLFFEVNAYKKNTALSHHHTSTIHGRTYSRDSAGIDLSSGADKGYWKRR
jgi:hypothetical protein